MGTSGGSSIAHTPLMYAVCRSAHIHEIIRNICVYKRLFFLFLVYYSSSCSSSGKLHSITRVHISARLASKTSGGLLEPLNVHTSFHISERRGKSRAYSTSDEARRHHQPAECHYYRIYTALLYHVPYSHARFLLLHRAQQNI